MWLIIYRDLIWNLTLTDLKIKYQSSTLGFAWSLLNPLLMMLVLYAVFANVFRFDQDNFALYILVGLIVWRFLANGTSIGMCAIIGRPGLVTKIFIPRQILVLSTTLSCFISSLLEFCILLPLIFIFGFKITPYILFFPIIHGIFFFIVFGISLMLASLYVYFRDLNQIWDVLLQLGFFLSPIAYPLSVVPEKYLFYYLLNPVTVIMEMDRNILLYGKSPEPFGLLYIILVGIFLMIIGFAIFKKLERRFAEAI